MATNGMLYKVRGPRGVYYAIYDPPSGRLWTERSDDAARSQARELGLTLGPPKSVTHHELMRLLGRDDTPGAPTSNPVPSDAAGTDPAEPSGQGSDRPIRSSMPFGRLDPGPEILVSKSEQGPSVFASQAPVTPPQSDEEHEIVDTRNHLSRRSRGNPFADRKKPGRRS